MPFALRQPPNWTEKTVTVAKTGDVFLCRGARTWFRVLSDEPFLHLVFDIPNPGYDVEELAAAPADRKLPAPRRRGGAVPIRSDACGDPARA
jgi:hypothetical protein